MCDSLHIKKGRDHPPRYRCKKAYGKNSILEEKQVPLLRFRYLAQGSFSRNCLQDLLNLNRFIEDLAGKLTDFFLPFRLALPKGIEDNNRGIMVFQSPLFEFREQRGDRTFEVDNQKRNAFIVSLKRKLFDRLRCDNPILILQEDGKTFHQILVCRMEENVLSLFRYRFFHGALH